MSKPMQVIVTKRADCTIVDTMPYLDNEIATKCRLSSIDIRLLNYILSKVDKASSYFSQNAATSYLSITWGEFEKALIDLQRLKFIEISHKYYHKEQNDTYYKIRPNSKYYQYIENVI